MPYNDNNKYINNNIRVNGNPQVEDGFFLLSEAAKQCSYSQEYLSLLARKGELRAKKFGRNWYTKMEWLREYIDLHSAAKKGNSRGEILGDKEISKELEESSLNDSVSEAVQKVWVNFATKCKSKIEAVGKNINQTLVRVRGVFVLPKKQVVVFKRGKVRQYEVARRQALIDELVTGIEKLDDNIDLLMLPNMRKAKRMTSHYPFAQASNRSILECATEVIESSIEKVKLNVAVFLGRLLREHLDLFWFRARLSFKSFAYAPIFTVRYWPSVSWLKRLQVATTSLLVLLLIGVSVLSQVNYELANNLHADSVKVAEVSVKTAQDVLVTGMSKFADSVDEVDAKTKELINNQTQGMVAGAATYSLPKITSQKLIDGLAYVKVAQNDLSNWQRDPETQKLLASGFKLAVEGTKKVKTLGVKGETTQVRGVGDDLLVLVKKINFEASRKDNFIYKTNQTVVAQIVDRVIGGMTGWYDVGDKETANVLADKGRKANTAFLGYMKEFDDPGRKVLADRTGKYTKLDRLIVRLISGSSEGLDTVAGYLDSLFDRTRSSLGDSYLAFLDTLNLQPAYSHLATDRMLEGEGDDPLDLERASGIDDGGLAVVPLEERSVEEREGLADRIRNTFSDEVEVVPDEDTASGVIKPVDDETSFDDFMYVVVPLRGKEVKE